MRVCLLLPGLMAASIFRLAAVPVNLSPGGTVAVSSADHGSTAGDLNDGNRDGHFYQGGSVWHSGSADDPPWAEVDLGGEYFLDRVMLWPRTDVVQGSVKDLRILVTNAAGAVVHDQVYLAGTTAGQPWGTVAVRGLKGRTVRVERTDMPRNPAFMAFAELEVWGQTAPVPENLALNQPAAAVSPGAYDTPPKAGNDGVIDGDYTHPGHPVFHSGVAAPGDYYEVDLGGGAPVNRTVDLVRLFNRTDFTNNASLKLVLKSAAGAVVWSETVNAARETVVRGGRQYDITVDVPGTVEARWARVETVAAEPLVFAELEVFAPGEDTTPPVVQQTDPSNGGLVAELTYAVITFSEETAGVEAADLLINGEPAAEAVPGGSGAWLFRFAQPVAGTVTFSWAAGHGIADTAGNAFMGGSWQVVLDPSLPAPKPYVSEFLAENRGGLEDVDGESPDWIEITNPGPTVVNLGGWHLSDDPGHPGKWRFPPPVVLQPGESVVVFASSKDRRTAGEELHTNFKLDQDGDSVLLVKPDGVTVADAVLNFPRQTENVSFGTGRRLDAGPLLAAGAAAKVLIPSGPVNGWTARTGFDDTGWMSARTGIGFDQSGGMGGDGPLGYWDFNEAAAPQAVPDKSGRGLTGTVVNGTYSADGGGRSGQAGDRAMNFNGNGLVNITGAAAGAFDRITAANAVAISVWVYGAAAQPANGFLFFAGSGANGTGTRVLDAHVPWSDSVVYWDTAGCCDPGRHRLSVGVPDPALWKGKWNHYVLQKRGDVKEIWLNGAPLVTGSGTEAMMNFRSLYLGAATAGGGDGYRGLIDDFAIWDAALTPAQIGALNGGASPLTVNLLTPAVATDAGAAMRNVNASALVRVPFTLTEPPDFDLLELRMRYDDGFVAWLNGTAVARRNAPEDAVPGFNAAALTPRTAGAALTEEVIDVSRFAALLVPGENVLAVQGLNVAAEDADFLVLPELRTGEVSANRFFTEPTPGRPNGAGVAGFVADTVFAPRRGFYDTPQTVTISCATAGAVVVYTTDGSVPSLSNGTQSPSPAAVSVTTTTVLRAAAFLPAADLGPANVDTHTYLFPDHVAAQQRPPEAPVTWPGNHRGDYTMDARIVNNALPGYGLREALLSLPALSITAPPADVWGASGIYANSEARGDAWERGANAEWLDPAGGEGFHTGFGLAIHGNISRQKSFTPKHSLKMFFRSQYGNTALEYALFPDSPVRRFDQLILRAGSTDTFPCTEWAAGPLGPNGALYQRWARAWASYVRDQWVRDSQIAMGRPSAHGRYCHLYLNGIYWGLYNVCEHPDEDFQASYLGGSPNEYDVLVDFAELKNGDYTAWQQLMALSGGSAGDAAFQQMQGNHPDGTRNPAAPVLLNADSLIDYMALHIFCGGDDWPNHNWWAGRATRNPGAVNDGFHFFAWDQEISNVNVLYERTSWQTPPAKYADVNPASTPAQPYHALKQGSPEFRMRFADRVHRHFFNGGALTTAAARERWDARTAEIDKAIVAESARWGDYQPNLVNAGQPYRREVEWRGHLDWMAANYWPQINGVALQRLRSAGLYPAVHAPALNQHGGHYLPDFKAGLTNPNAGGAVLFTTDGTDPRLAGGGTSPQAVSYTAPFAVSGTLTVKARVLQGVVWSALLEAVFVPEPDRDGDGIPNDWELAFGLNPDSAEDAADDADDDGFTNLAEYAAGTLPRDGASRFTAAFVTGPDGVRVEFYAAAGRRYRLESASAPSGPWQVLRSEGAPVTGGELSWTLPAEGVRRFCRVVAEPE